MGLFESFKGVRYRVRIFDNNNFIMSAEIPEKGQRKFEIIIHKPLLGEKVKLAFMLNPNIRPKIFKGKIFEVDFDVRDSTQLADLFDVFPEVVKEIDETFYKRMMAESQKKKENEGILEAEFTVMKDGKPVSLFEDEPAKPEEPEPSEDERIIDTIIGTTKDTLGAVNGVIQMEKLEGKDKKQKIQDLLNLSAKHPKLLYWLPGLLDIGPEIHAIVSQTRMYRVGVLPTYYLAQSNAQISEKTLTRPREQTGWQQVAMLALPIIGVIVVLGLLIWLFKG